MSDPEPHGGPAAPTAWRDRIDLLTTAPQLTPTRIAGAALAVVAVGLAAWFAFRTPPGPPTESLLPVAGSSDAPSSTTSTVTQFVFAHAAGAVQQPGVYRLPSGARVTDLIDAAGGPTADADVDQLNLAATVADGERVYVPRVGEVVAGAVPGNGAEPSTAPVNLNTATLEELDLLPGIGPTTARAIIDERDRRGGFRSVEELLEVRGIGPAKLDAIRDLVTV